MKQKSKSLRQLRSPSLQINNHPTGLPPALNYHSRLLFPQVGDTQFYYDSGKKHYNNQSNRLLKIILPQKYALQQPLIQREKSVPPPHLQTQSNPKKEKLYLENSISPTKNLVRQQSQNTKISSLIDEQLDRLKNLFDKKVSLNIQRANNSSKLSLSNHISEIIAPSPRASVKAEKKSYLLYNPENKPRYDRFEQVRKLNPTHLSTGLSII